MLYSLTRWLSRLKFTMKNSVGLGGRARRFGAAGQEFHAVFAFRNKTEIFGPSKIFMRFRVGGRRERGLQPRASARRRRELGYGGTGR